ncbi:MAG TPA: caspase family protein, partial [Polyangium sp.]|nr:caspase family protein [Polyangium sp.]
MNAGSIRHHILLVGIDAYPKVPALHGSVNDVDALETIFLDRLLVRPEAITKLVAPHPHAVRSARVTEDKPTLDNLRRAFETLASDAVRPGDRVFIHYSGHGTQVFSRVTRAAREALVPVDGAASGNLLLDDELNGFLRRIAARTEDLTVLLDCCCSAGATRSALVPKESSIRFCQVYDEFEAASTARTRSFSWAEEGGLLSPFDPSDPGFLVVSSAQSGQSAYEGMSPRGVRHGAFTAALLDLLTPMPADKLTDLRWADVWPVLLGRVTAGFSGQNPCLMGRCERRVFGGDFKKGDAGFPVVEERGSYHLQAGTLVGVGVGATVAVYGSEPSFFPTLHSAEDRQARLGLLRVESATASSAIASPMGGPVTLDAGARARLVTSGPADKLVVRLEPFDVKLAEYLEGEAFVRVVSPVDAAEQGAEAMVGWSAQGSWWLGDDVFGEHMPLIQGPMSELRELAAALRHYALYQLPLRLVRRDRLGLGLLRLRLLDAQHAQRL